MGGLCNIPVNVNDWASRINGTDINHEVVEAHDPAVRGRSIKRELVR